MTDYEIIQLNTVRRVAAMPEPQFARIVELRKLYAAATTIEEGGEILDVVEEILFPVQGDTDAVRMEHRPPQSWYDGDEEQLFET
jgi:hypothetical protein